MYLFSLEIQRGHPNYLLLIVLAYLFLFPTSTILVSAQKTIGDFIPQLKDINSTQAHRGQVPGGQNDYWCCCQAVEASLDVSNGSLVIRPGYQDWLPFFSNSNVSQFSADAQASRFPCNATWLPTQSASPEVRANYSWASSTCPGWQLSSKNNPSAWLQPLGGFLVPAIVFCLSVPRRRKLCVPQELFAPDFARTSSYLFAIPGAICAGIIVLTDTLIWLGICFAFAGPMILSETLEALYDHRVLNFAREKVWNQRLKRLDMRCHLLMIILTGNLDLGGDETREEPQLKKRNRIGSMAHNPGVEVSRYLSRGASEGSSTQAETFRSFDLQHRYGDGLNHSDLNVTSKLRNVHSMAATSATRASRLNNELETDQDPVRPRSDDLCEREGASDVSPWADVERMICPLRDTYPSMHNQHSRENGASESHLCRQECESTEQIIVQTKTRLRAMLHCQDSFGATVGGAVIFYLGGFVFAVLQSLNLLGDEDVALSLAFGQLFMVIPHVAIVSSLLLAGRNPSILEGICATKQPDKEDSTTFLGLRFDLADPSCYRATWPTARARMKRSWICRYIDTYMPPNGDEDLKDLRTRIHVNFRDWCLVLALTIFFIGVPLILAFITALYTPVIGLSCRALVVLIYACTQIVQVGLWIWGFAGPPSRILPRFFRRKGWLDSNGFYDPTSLRHIGGDETRTKRCSMITKIRSPGVWSVRSLSAIVWYFSTFTMSWIAVLTTLGGTCMQLLGVDTALICKVTVKDWFTPIDERPMVTLSQNSQLMIDSAKTYWVPCAVTAIVFMAVVAFIAWWYQRRMRDLFIEGESCKIDAQTVLTTETVVKHVDWDYPTCNELRVSSQFNILTTGASR